MNLDPLSSRASLVALSFAALAACGGISDPTKAQVAHVSGALTVGGGAAPLPGGARVALVWRKTSGFIVTKEAPVLNGHFELDLVLAPEARFSPAAASSAPTTARLPTSGPGGGGADPTTSLGTSTEATGSVDSPALEKAVAGFVLYLDENGNGKLDVDGELAKSPDRILGGSADLAVTYFRGGGSLDYEALRDKAGVAPTAGFDLSYKDDERWMPFDVVELTAAGKDALPSAVCDVAPENFIPPTPTAGDPHVVCTSDKRSWSWKALDSECSVNNGACGAFTSTCTNGFTYVLANNGPTPAGWPCP